MLVTKYEMVGDILINALPTSGQKPRKGYVSTACLTLKFNEQVFTCRLLLNRFYDMKHGKGEFKPKVGY